MTRPTMRLPWTTKSPKVETILPASACSRISRVVVMEIDSRNSVVISSTAGKAEKATGVLM